MGKKNIKYIYLVGATKHQSGKEKQKRNYYIRSLNYFLDKLQF